MPSLAAVLRPLSTRQRPDEPQSHGTTEAQGRLTPQPHARISSDIRPCFLFLVHPIAPSASDEPFSFPLRTPRTRKRPPRAPTSPRKSPHGSCSANDNAHRRTQNRPPCPLPAQRAPESNHPRTRSPKSSPEIPPLLPPRNPTKSPICAAGESRERQLIQQTRHFIQRPPESFAPHRRLLTFALSSRQKRNTNQK